MSPTRPQTTETSCWISQPVLQPVTPRRAAPPAEMITRARARQRVRPVAYAPDGHACFCSVCGRWHLLPTGVSAAAHCLLPQRRWHGLPQRRTYERRTSKALQACKHTVRTVGPPCTPPWPASKINSRYFPLLEGSAGLVLPRAAAAAAARSLHSDNVVVGGGLLSLTHKWQGSRVRNDKGGMLTRLRLWPVCETRRHSTRHRSTLH